jgi:hypothetical protein
MAHQGPHQPGAGDPYGTEGSAAPQGWQQPAPYGAAPSGGWQAPPEGGYQGAPPQGGYPQPYGQQYGQQYGQPYGGYPYAPPQRTNGLAIASMVLGILWLYWIGSILALVFGYTAKKQIRERGEAGGGMATAGIVLGWIGVGFLALALVAGIASGF